MRKEVRRFAKEGREIAVAVLKRPPYEIATDAAGLLDERFPWNERDLRSALA